MRRIHLPALSLGEIDLPPSQAHYLRDVLRLTVGQELSAFSTAGHVGLATIVAISPQTVRIRIDRLEQHPASPLQLTVAAAVPKAARADWMIEKLSELGVARFIPLAAERSVVLPEGSSKADRWRRIAEEASRQSGRFDVMRIDILTALAALLEHPENPLLHLSLQPDAEPLANLANYLQGSATLLIGPEGGWTDTEIARFATAGALPARLTATTLRIETAAVAAAAVVLSSLAAFAPAATKPEAHEPHS